jgi:hypothetical protein
MKNSLDAAMQGIEGLINADGSGKQQSARLKCREFGGNPIYLGQYRAAPRI